MTAEEIEAEEREKSLTVLPVLEGTIKYFLSDGTLLEIALIHGQSADFYHQIEKDVRRLISEYDPDHTAVVWYKPEEIQCLGRQDAVAYRIRTTILYSRCNAISRCNALAEADLQQWREEEVE